MTGKSILTDYLTENNDPRPVFHSDNLPHMEWKEKSAALSAQVADLDMFVIAGIAADRAVLRGTVVDAIIYCVEKHQPLNKWQKALCKAVKKRVAELSRKYPVCKYRGRYGRHHGI